ncbi:hypothetical protein ABZ403_25855, partial [Micromonospora zamorensis]|uniref:hypothetical protein n=1 Tax=Micromonospora zamorensis TaxID=709883 RepID=UPI0033E2D5C0
RGADAGLVWLVVTGLLIQVTESAMFGTGQTYPYVFWTVVAAALLHLPKKRGPADRDAAARAGLPHAEARQQRAGVFDDKVPPRPTVVLR